MCGQESILELLQSDEPENIRAGAFAAAEAPDIEYVPFLAQHLKSHNLGVQEAADMALRKIGGPETVQTVIPLLRSDEAPVRNLSMDILRDVGGTDFDSLATLLQDEDADIRIFVADIMGSTKNARAVELLCKALLRDPEVNVRYQAAVSLGELANKEASNCLGQAMNDEEWVQFAVVEALTKIRDESSINALLRALDSSTELVCSMIIDALSEMGNVKVVSVLLKRLANSPGALRNKIVRAVVQILGGKALTLLSEVERDNFRMYALSALNDEDKEIQDAAIEGLSFVGGAGAAKAILKLAEALDPVNDQERLEMIMEYLAGIDALPVLEREVLEGSWKGAIIAVKTLKLRNNPDETSMLMDIFWDKDRDLQREIANTLALIAGPDACPFFRNLLEKHEDGDVIKAGLMFLGDKIRNPEDTDLLFAFVNHPYDDVKEVALDACIALNGPAMTAHFKELFQSPEPINRFMATYALGRIGLQDNIEEIKAALEDEVPDIRKIAVKSLIGSNECPEFELSLIFPRLSDENRDVRLAVVELLGECLTDDSIDHLLTALDDTDDWVRIRAVEALAQGEVVSAASKLVPLLEDPNKLVALKVIEALGSLGGQTAFRSLLEVAGSDDLELQAAAEEALEHIKVREED